MINIWNLKSLLKGCETTEYKPKKLDILKNAKMFPTIIYKSLGVRNYSAEGYS